MGFTNVEQRFKQLRALEGSVGARVHEIVTNAAIEINKLAQESPALMTVIQHLEQVAHVAVTAPTMQDLIADPTSAGQAPAGSASPETTSTEPSSPSAGESTP